MADDQTVAESRSWIGSLAVVLAGISALGMLILVVGDIANIEGAEEGEEGSVIFGIAWLGFFLGGIATLVAGLTAFLVGRARGNAAMRGAGLTALAYVVIAIAVLVFFTVVD